MEYKNAPLASPEQILIEQFKSKLAGLNYSKETIMNYELSVKDFADYLQSVNKTLVTFSAEDLPAYRESFMKKDKEGNFIKKTKAGEPYNPSSVGRHLKAISTFFEQVKGYRIKVRSPKTGKHLPEWLDKDEVTKLLDNIKESELETWFKLLYRYALRVSESINLTISDLDFKKKVIYIRAAKGGAGEPDIMGLQDKDIQTLKEWIEARSKKKDVEYQRTTWLFPYFLGRNKEPSRQKAWLYLKQLAEDSKIARDKVYPHVFRHSRAVHLRGDGASLEDLRDFLRHERYDTTLIYATVTPENLTKKLAGIESPI